ncbi:MAG: DUF29 domain-containing protein, partial [Thermosynechococcaceae cyanobacterium]
MSLETGVKTSLYEADYQLWLEQTLEQLRSHDFNNLDLDHLTEEIEDLGKRDKRSLSSYLGLAEKVFGGSLEGSQ